MRNGIISAPRLFVDGRLTGPGAVVVADGVIADVLPAVPPPAPDHLALDRGLLTPGMVDVQINGSFGVDFMQGTADDWRTVAVRLIDSGVTAFQPTFVTAPLDDLVAALDRAAAAVDALASGPGARVLGVHVEGPFLSPRHPGVHDTSVMLEPTPDHTKVLYDGSAAGCITMVTLAPELPGALDTIRDLTARGVRVCIGHTDATGDVVRAAVDAGAVMVTHLFNAQRGLGHREPGVPGQALAEPGLTLGLIADLKHVAAPICQVVFAAAAGRVAIVTDAVASAGMPPGVYELGGQQVHLAHAEALARRADGTIAGSSLTLDRAVRNLVGIGIPVERVLDAATRVPADVLRRTDLGRLAPGAHADLVWWDDDLHPLRTWVGGETPHARAADHLSATATPGAD